MTWKSEKSWHQKLNKYSKSNYVNNAEWLIIEPKEKGCD